MEWYWIVLIVLGSFGFLQICSLLWIGYSDEEMKTNNTISIILMGIALIIIVLITWAIATIFAPFTIIYGLFQPFWE